jgi:predicted RNA-binding protein with PUA-like domain
MKHWLMKTEPDVFGIADLERVRTEPWTGVRNTWARNYMRDQMTVGDPVLFYHSSCAPPGVAGLARVSKTGVVDETQFDPASKYFDEAATREKPVWVCVEVEYVETLPRVVTLEELRRRDELANMAVLRIPRLSVQPVTDAEYAVVVAMSREPAPAPKPKPKPKARAAARKPKPKAKPRPKPRRKSTAPTKTPRKKKR